MGRQPHCPSMWKRSSTACGTHLRDKPRALLIRRHRACRTQPRHPERTTRHPELDSGATFAPRGCGNPLNLIQGQHDVWLQGIAGVRACNKHSRENCPDAAIS